MTVSLDQEAHEKLTKRAKREGRTAGNLAAFLLSLAIEMDLYPTEVEEETNGKTSTTTQR
jgi:hypothetical protein